MNVTLCSAFRNATPYLQRYVKQVESLHFALRRRGDNLSAVLCHGDSTDRTGHLLISAIDASQIFPATVLQYNHGGPDYGSVVHPQRFANLAAVCNAIWARLPSDADAVIWVESDLIWEPSVMLALLDDLAHVPAVAPMVMLERGGFPDGYFYDSWAFSRMGTQVRVMPPYFDDLDADTDFLELDTAGSCLVMRGNVARGLVWPPEDVIRGICRQIHEDYGVWLNAKQKVIHQ